MLKILTKVIKTGVVTEKFERNADLERLGIEIKTLVDKQFAGSLSIRAVDVGSCNGCELEIHALNNPYYNIERFGVHFVASPRHADALLVTGVVSRHMETALLRVYEATPAPKFIIAMGDCAVNGGEFGVSYASCGAVGNVINVDVAIPRCPPPPLAVMQAILQFLKT